MCVGCTFQQNESGKMLHGFGDETFTQADTSPIWTLYKEHTKKRTPYNIKEATYTFLGGFCWGKNTGFLPDLIVRITSVWGESRPQWGQTDTESTVSWQSRWYQWADAHCTNFPCNINKQPFTQVIMTKYNTLTPLFKNTLWSNSITNIPL